MGRFGRRSLIAAIGLLAAIIILALFLFPRKSTPNILLVILDTVRRDGLSLYGNPRHTTPAIDELAKTSTVFTNAYSTSCWTLPAHASMFTGRYALSHGVTQKHLYLRDGFVTLAEALRQEGYRTVGFSANPLVSGRTNLNQGFGEFYELWKAAPGQKADGNHVNSEIGNWLQKHAGGWRPFFMFINYMDAHRPYEPPDEYKSLYLERSLDNEYAEKINAPFGAYYAGKVHYDDADFETMHSLYDGEVRYLDDVVRDLIGMLKEYDQFENTVIIITSDHGENIGEHGHIDHVFSLYDTTLKVPLLIHHPALFGKGVTDHRNVMLVDLFPTILHIAQVDPKLQPSSGISLLGEQKLLGERPVFAEYYYPRQALAACDASERDAPEMKKYKRTICSFEMEGAKLIWGSDGVHELYNLKEDPGEKVNLASQDSEKLNVLLDGLKRYQELQASPTPRDSEQHEPDFDKEDIETLRTLGYIK